MFSCLTPPPPVVATALVAAATVMGKAEGQRALWHGHVTAVTVAPEYRRLGVAKQLMDSLETVREACCRKVGEQGPKISRSQQFSCLICFLNWVVSGDRGYTRKSNVQGGQLPGGVWCWETLLVDLASSSAYTREPHAFAGTSTAVLLLMSMTAVFLGSHQLPCWRSR